MNLISLNYKNPESVFRVRPESSEKESSQSPETSGIKDVSLSSAGLKGVHHHSGSVSLLDWFQHSSEWP